MFLIQQENHAARLDKADSYLFTGNFNSDYRLEIHFTNRKVAFFLTTEDKEKLEEQIKEYFVNQSNRKVIYEMSDPRTAK